MNRDNLKEIIKILCDDADVCNCNKTCHFERLFSADELVQPDVGVAASLRVIAQEMRTRRINNGKHTSPTLEAWADRIEAAAGLLS